MMQKWSLRRVTRSVGQFQLREKWEDSEQSQKFEGKTEKVLKTIFEMQNTRFSRLIQVTSQSPGSLAKTLQAKSFEKIC